MAQYEMKYAPLRDLERQFTQIKQALEEYAEDLRRMSKSTQEGLESETNKLTLWSAVMLLRAEDVGQVSKCLENVTDAYYLAEQLSYESMTDTVSSGVDGKTTGTVPVARAPSGSAGSRISTATTISGISKVSPVPLISMLRLAALLPLLKLKILRPFLRLRPLKPSDSFGSSGSSDSSGSVGSMPQSSDENLSVPGSAPDTLEPSEPYGPFVPWSNEPAVSRPNWESLRQPIDWRNSWPLFLSFATAGGASFGAVWSLIWALFNRSAGKAGKLTGVPGRNGGGQEGGSSGDGGMATGTGISAFEQGVFSSEEDGINAQMSRGEGVAEGIDGYQNAGADQIAQDNTDAAASLAEGAAGTETATETATEVAATDKGIIETEGATENVAEAEAATATASEAVSEAATMDEGVVETESATAVPSTVGSGGGGSGGGGSGGGGSGGGSGGDPGGGGSGGDPGGGSTTVEPEFDGKSLGGIDRIVETLSGLKAGGSAGAGDTAVTPSGRAPGDAGGAVYGPAGPGASGSAAGTGGAGIAAPVIGVASAASMAASGLGISNKLGKGKADGDAITKQDPAVVKTKEGSGVYAGDLKGEYVILASALSLLFTGASVTAAVRGKNRGKPDDRFRIGYGTSAVLSGGAIQERS